MKKLFICYSKDDRAVMREVREHLQNLRHLGLTTWTDQDIKPGDGWETNLKSELRACDGAVFLVSAASLNSEYIQKVEIPTLRAAGKPIFPLIIDGCNWQQRCWLKALQVRPPDAKPLMTFGGPTKRAIVIAAFARDIGEKLGIIPPPDTPAAANQTVTSELTQQVAQQREQKQHRAAVEVAHSMSAPPENAEVPKKRTGHLTFTIELQAEAAKRLRAAIDAGLLQPKSVTTTEEGIDVDVYEIDGIQVMLDETVALFYDRPVKSLNQARDRNAERFADAEEPRRYAFQLSREEWDDCRSQSLSDTPGRGGRRSPPWAYTEEGVAMLATVLRTPAAVEGTKLIVETFVEARRRATPVPPGNHDGVGDPARETGLKRAFKKRLSGFRAR
ncbi:MAG: ORF6N domain-containing protein [Paracoccaceae bacterium]